MLEGRQSGAGARARGIHCQSCVLPETAPPATAAEGKVLGWANHSSHPMKCHLCS